jgi:CDGSH-type Zn-finger protein
MSEPKIADRRPAVLELEAGTYYWCACGLSAGQPFCDGAHKGSGLAPIKFELAQAGKVALCKCKHAATKPYCDGAHKTL